MDLVGLGAIVLMAVMLFLALRREGRRERQLREYGKHRAACASIPRPRGVSIEGPMMSRSAPRRQRASNGAPVGFIMNVERVAELPPPPPPGPCDCGWEEILEEISP